VPLSVLRAAAHAAMPWKNGGGTTLEIARAPAGGDFDWRLSVADVREDGPFSSFPGIERHILLVEGAGMRLVSARCCIELAPDGPGAIFDGAEAFTGRLADGPVRDLNLMLRRGRASGSIERIRLDGLHAGARAIEPGAALLFVCVLGGTAIALADGHALLTLQRLDVLRLDAGDAPVRLEPGGGEPAAVALVRIREAGLRA